MDLNDLLGMENYPSELMPDLPDDFPVSFTCSKCRSNYPNVTIHNYQLFGLFSFSEHVKS